jgi:YaiO family outer membrane protein
MRVATKLARGAAALTLAFAAAMSSAALADTNGQFTVTDQESTFSSPGNAYGPWHVQALQYQFKTGNDVPSITLFNRNDDDRPVSSSSRAIYVDDYHAWSGTFYTYAQVSFANGNIQPYRLGYLEADAKLTREQNVVAAAGGGFAQNPDGSTTHWLSVGPRLYRGPMIYEVRFLPASTDGIGTSATEGVVTYNRLGRDQVVLTYVSGSEPSVLAGFPPSFATYQRLNEGDIVWRHWILPDFGIVLGGTVGHHADRATGNTIYDQRAITFGLFYGRSVGQPR